MLSQCIPSPKKLSYILILLSILSLLINVKIHHSAQTHHKAEDFTNSFRTTAIRRRVDTETNKLVDKSFAVEENSEEIRVNLNLKNVGGVGRKKNNNNSQVSTERISKITEKDVRNKNSTNTRHKKFVKPSDKNKRLTKQSNSKYTKNSNKLKLNLVDEQDQIQKDHPKLLLKQEEQQHSLAGLSCDKFGGPKKDILSHVDMIYWNDIPEDSQYKSPFYDEDKYLTFETDHGGWNNVRMAMETVLVAAHAMGRTLVLPPEHDMYLLSNDMDFFDFFHLESLKLEHTGINIITMKEFLNKVAMKDELINKETKKAMKPPNDQTDWNRKQLRDLWIYLSSVGYVSDWEPWKCLAAFPASKSAADIKELQTIFENINTKSPQPELFVGNPTPVNASAYHRMREQLATRDKKLCMYNETFQEQRLVHFSASYGGTRLLAPFYSFLFFQDWHHDLFYKRFIRDHVRYQDEIMCVAARIIHALHLKSDKNSLSTGKYDSIHVRRGDFQFKETRLDGNQLFDCSKNELQQGGVLYVATDERNKTFFQPYADNYEVYYLDDFRTELGNISKTYYGMIDQLITAKSRVFFGTWFSTFSSYINRMRGYYSTKYELEGNKDGVLDSWYFEPKGMKRNKEMRVYWPVRLPLYMREFPTSWREIDFDAKVESNNKKITKTEKSDAVKKNIIINENPDKQKILIKPSISKDTKTNDKSKIKLVQNENSPKLQQEQHSLAGLSCDKFGGPKKDILSHVDMIYWNDIPEDSEYKSPFYNEDKYLTFETDHGGWNNVRMAMETVLVAAHAMGRTLVLPPEHDMYLLSNDMDFFDFFHLESLKLEHTGINIITMKEFLNKVAMKDELINKETKKAMKPPNDQTDWNRKQLRNLWIYLSSVGYMPDWEPSNCLAAFPASKSAADIKELQSIFENINTKSPQPELFVGNPTPVNASAYHRMREQLATRSEKLCMYNETLQGQKLIHFSASNEGTRLLAPFYSILFFQDWHHDLFYKRFIRDHVRYQDEIMCVAARIIHALHLKSDKNSLSTGKYDSIHVRRGDFQFKETRLDGSQLFDCSKNELQQGGVLYVATDERNKTFFQPYADNYEVYYLDDFRTELGNISKTYYGMIDQLITAKSRVFFGTWFSTFSSYINRMRGYYSTKYELEGNKDGVLDSWYFEPKGMKRNKEMRVYWPVRLPLYMREFPTSWREIDFDVKITGKS